MAQRFMSGLYHQYPDENGGRFISKLLIEWLTQVVGWSVVDFVGSKWALVAASGTGTADATAFDTVEITSPSYAFTTAHAGWFLTLTGYSGGDASHDGIYRIRRLLNTAGSVYTLQIYPTYGVHHAGLPVQSGLNWRVWAGNDTYCPTTTSEIAVIGGTGHTGAGLSDGTRTSVSLSISQVGSTSTLEDTGATFLDSDVGKKITISGSAVSGNNATFTIASRISNTQITYTNVSGGTDSFTGSWSITYDFHVWYKCNTIGSGTGTMIISPYASWNATSHDWNDARHTSEIGPYGGNRMINIIWAEADTDHFTFSVHTVSGDLRYKRYYPYAMGELDAFYPENDPRPLWMWSGGDENAYTDAVYFGLFNPVVGTGTRGDVYWYYDRFRGLGYDDLTTLTYYATFVHSLASADSNVHLGTWKNFSKYSDRLYRVPIILESRTSGFMEYRGTLRNLWACNGCLPILSNQGANEEYLHVARGLMMPWNGSRLAWAFTGLQVVG